MNVIRNRYVVVALGLLAMMAALIVAIPPIEADTTSERLDALNDLYEIPRNSWYNQYDYLRVDGRYYWM